MSERLKGQFMGCPYHDDDYEACIQYSGQAPCDPPDGWRLVPIEPTPEMIDAAMYRAGESDVPRGSESWRAMGQVIMFAHEAAPKP